MTRKRQDEEDQKKIDFSPILFISGLIRVIRVPLDFKDSKIRWRTRIDQPSDGKISSNGTSH
jgi:hypothetical protein